MFVLVIVMSYSVRIEVPHIICGRGICIAGLFFFFFQGLNAGIYLNFRFESLWMIVLMPLQIACRQQETYKSLIGNQLAPCMSAVVQAVTATTAAATTRRMRAHDAADQLSIAWLSAIARHHGANRAIWLRLPSRLHRSRVAVHFDVGPHAQKALLLRAFPNRRCGLVGGCFNKKVFAIYGYMDEWRVSNAGVRAIHAGSSAPLCTHT